ncbi:uncharacterized protein [Syngnathus scovelli]|nr:uncharacterized protein LOC125991647 isoform X2 [Syngnathus scovelli]
MLELGRRWAGDARPTPGTAELPPEPSGERGHPSVVAQAQSEDFQEFSPTHVRRCDSRLGFVRTFRHASFNAEGQGEQGIRWFRSADGAPLSCRDVITPPPQFKDAPDDGVEWSQLTGDRQWEPSESDWSQVSAAFSSSSSSTSSSSLLTQCDYAPWPAGKVISICPPATHASTRHLLGRSTSAHQNRGFLLHHKLRPNMGLYREGRKYDVLRPIHSGASGTVPAVYWVSPWRTEAADEDRGDPEAEGRPTSLRDETAWDSDVDIYVGEEDGDYEGDCEDEVDEEAAAPAAEAPAAAAPAAAAPATAAPATAAAPAAAAPAQYLRALLDVFPVLRRGQWTGGAPGLTDGQRQHLPGAALGDAHARTPEPRTPEPRDDPPSCFSSSSQASLKDSERSSDDGSSGVFSSGGGHEESWGRARGPPSRRFEGVHIWIEDARGRRLKIRERRWVRVGHVAVGIGRQMSASAFTLEMPDRKSVCFRRQIGESHLRLRCVDAPDSCPRWTWRVQDGKLEVRQ